MEWSGRAISDLTFSALKRLAAIVEILYIVFASPAFAVSASQVPGRRT
jgi:hypothetical protein